MKIDDNWVNIISKSTSEIKEQTNTVFRQNFTTLNKLDINFLLFGKNWKDRTQNKDALVAFSKTSLNLVVIPKKVVDTYIFEPIFENSFDGYDFKMGYENYKHRENSIRLKFHEDAGYLIVSLRPGINQSGRPIDILRLPYEYWERVDIISENPLHEFINIVIKRTRNLSEGNGVISLGEIFNQWEPLS